MASWRIVATFPVGSSVDGLAASGPRDAWAVESCHSPCRSADGLILRRWNGSTWQPRPQPAIARHTGDAEPQLAMPPGSSVLWGVYELYDGKLRASAVRWTGGSWAAASVFPAGTIVTTLIAPSPSSAWVFGGRGPQFAYHYNGKTWSGAPSPNPGFFSARVVARSASDIWALSIGGRLAISRWNGRRWVGQALPAMPSAADSILGGGIVASGRVDIWGYGYSSIRTGANWLVHWNGKSWSNVKVPYPLSKSGELGIIGPDGHGGVWFAAVAVRGTGQSLFHDTASGHWSVVPVSAPKGTTTAIQGFAPIPGSTSVYAYGVATNGKTGATEGVILKYA
jgi:hypothetical protein